MDIDIKVDEKYKDTKIVIYTNKVDENVSNIIDKLSCLENNVLKAYKNQSMYMLKQNEIETVYSENGKVYVRANKEIYSIKYRLYEVEKILDNTIFVRISQSEIVNFNKVKNIDFKILGTLVLNFKNGNKSYVSRRYIPKIKEFLKI